MSDIVSAGATGLSGTELDVIIEPQGGHGYDAVKELGGFFVMLNVNLQGAETANSGDFDINASFRKTLLIQNPYSNGSPATSSTLRGTKAVLLNSTPTPGTFQIGENITQSITGATGIVVDWDATNKILYYVQTRFTNQGIDVNGNKTSLSGLNVITGRTSGATGTPIATTGTVNNVSFTSGYSAPEIDAHSGNVIYIENRSPIKRASDQTENIKLIVEF